LATEDTVEPEYLAQQGQKLHQRVLYPPRRGTLRAVEGATAKYVVHLEGTLAGADVEAMSDLGDAVMDVLMDADGDDPCVDGDATTGRFGVEIVVEGRTENEALSKGVQIISEALETVRLVNTSAHTQDLDALDRLAS
jgi:hypothetical protein